MAINSYLVGQNVELRAVITDHETREHVDPPSVNCTVKPPTGSNATPATVKESDGIYTANFTPSVAGIHTYRFTGTGTNPVSEENKFYVRGSEV